MRCEAPVLAVAAHPIEHNTVIASPAFAQPLLITFSPHDDANEEMKVASANQGNTIEKPWTFTTTPIFIGKEKEKEKEKEKNGKDKQDTPEPEKKDEIERGEGGGEDGDGDGVTPTETPDGAKVGGKKRTRGVSQASVSGDRYDGHLPACFAEDGQRIFIGGARGLLSVLHYPSLKTINTLQV